MQDLAPAFAISDSEDLAPAQEELLWAQAEPLFERLREFPEEQSAMLIPNMRLDAGLLVGATAIAVAVSPAEAADKYVFGVCKTATQSGGAEIGPVIDGGSYLFEYHGDDPRYQEKLAHERFFENAKVTLVKAPRHGKVLTEQGPWSSNTDYHYWPDKGYIGRDHFVMQVDKDSVRVRIEYMIEGLLDEEPDIGRCDPPHWKISSTTPALDSAALQTLRSAINIDPSTAVSNAAVGSGLSFTYANERPDKHLARGRPPGDDVTLGCELSTKRHQPGDRNGTLRGDRLAFKQQRRRGARCE